MTKKTILALVCGGLLVGAVFGAMAGFWAASRTWARVMEPVFVTNANQAHAVLVLLETDRQDELKLYLEAEIQHGLNYLDHLQQEGRIPDGSPMLLVRQRLQEYEDSHGFQTPNPFRGNVE